MRRTTLAALTMLHAVCGFAQEPGGSSAAELAHEGQVRSIQFSPDGRFLLTTSAPGLNSLHLWDLKHGTALWELKGQPFPEALGFSRDGSSVILAGGGCLLTRDGSLQHRLPQDVPTIGAISRDGRTLAGRGEGVSIVLVDLESGQILHKLPTTSVGPLEFSPDGRTLFILGNDLTFQRWDVATGNRLDAFRAPPALVPGTQRRLLRMSFTPDGEFIDILYLTTAFKQVGGDNRGEKSDATCHVTRIDATSGDLKRDLEATGSVVAREGSLDAPDAGFSDDGEVAWLSGTDGLRFVELATGREISKMPRAVCLGTGLLSRSGKFFAHPGEILLVSTAHVLEKLPDTCCHWAFSADEKLFAATSEDGKTVTIHRPEDMGSGK